MLLMKLFSVTTSPSQQLSPSLNTYSNPLPTPSPTCLLADTRKLLQVPAWHLHHTVIEAGFEAGRCGVGDGIPQLHQGLIECELCSDVGQRVTGRLAGQRRAPGQPRVHLDDVVLQQKQYVM
jgi:hypothetical protein